MAANDSARTARTALEGRVALVTGGSSGIGFHTALELARAGAEVVIAARDKRRGVAAAERIRTSVPGAAVEMRGLDLADLASVEAFAATWQGPLDLLVNNAGVMAPPYRLSRDGFELQIATNHLGPFALTGRLLPALLTRPGGRVVTVSSLFHRSGRIDFDDLQSERSYARWAAYAQTKLANLLFAFELDRRLAGLAAISVAAHPGIASTNLQVAGPLMDGGRLSAAVVRLGTHVVAQSAAHGAWPTLHAATAADVRGGDFFGPRALGGSRGRPVRTKAARSAYDEVAARRLWGISEELTGVGYPVATKEGPGPGAGPGPDVAGEGFEPS
jgi:NAD(P)-dependent dehydrogenase (short-subunit alcohol dehydrogenase family)